MIPVKLREMMNLQVGQEYEFSTLVKDGRKYICIDCGTSAMSVEEAVRTLKAAGLTVVEEGYKQEEKKSKKKS